MDTPWYAKENSSWIPTHSLVILRNKKYHVLYELISEEKANRICAKSGAVLKNPEMRKYYKLGTDKAWYNTKRNLPSDYFIEVHQKNIMNRGCIYVHGFDNSLVT